MANWKYTTIQHGARIALNLSSNDYCVADVIYKTQTHPELGSNGWANVGCHKLGEFFGISPGTVHKMLLRFEAAGLLEFDPASKDNKRMTAKFYDVAYLDNDAVQKVNTCSISERGGVQKVNGNRSKSEHNNIIVDKGIDKENVQNDVLPAAFENFWQAFGYKKNRKKAHSAFNRLTKANQKLCVEMIPAYLAYIAATNTPQMHPTTWINGERWNDDFTIPAGGKKVVNTDAALKDCELPKELQAGYAAYISGMIEKFPALWKSECRVLSAGEWLTFQRDHLNAVQRIHITVPGAAKIRAAVHHTLNEKGFERAKYACVFDAIIAAYRAAVAGETSGGI